MAKVRGRLRSAGLLLGALMASNTGCFGLIETDAPATDSDPGQPLGTGGSVQTACPPAQWDCSGLPLSCAYDPDENGVLYPVVTVDGSCRCDATRPAEPSDCAAGELFVCGSLGVRDVATSAELPFEPVSCRCAVNAGYYCAHCAKTGLIPSGMEVEGCGLDEVSSADSTPVLCGCGVVPH